MKIRTVDLSQFDIRCRVEPDLREGLLQAARADRTSVSEWLRRALRQAVAVRLAESPARDDGRPATFSSASHERVAA